MQKGKSFHFSFFPEKFLAGTLHLSDETRGVYILMLCRIWTLTPTQYSFPNTDPMWRHITGINDMDKVNSIRSELMKPGLEMFLQIRRKSVTFLLQNGLKKERVKQKKNSLQKSTNAKGQKKQRVTEKRPLNGRSSARCDSVTPSLFLIPSSEKQQRAPAGSAVVRDENQKPQKKITTKISELSNDEKKEKIHRLIWDILKPLLHVNQIEKILHFMPGISIEYIQEKISITKEKKPKCSEAFLMSAIIQNYQPMEPDSKEFKKKTKSQSLLRIAQNRPISEKEYNSLDENIRKYFEKKIIQDPSYDRHYLVSIPTKFECKIDRMSFKSFEIGDFIDEIHFAKVKEYLKSNFESKPYKPPERTLFHLVSK